MTENRISLKESLFQIFFCLYIFWEPILFSILGRNQVELSGSTMQLILIFITVAAWFFYFLFKPKYKSERTLLFIAAIFGLLYYSTQYFYNEPAPQRYTSNFLRWASDCVSAIVIAFTFTKQKSYSVIHLLLPIECLILTPFMTQMIISFGFDYGQYSSESGLNYQVIAYYMAVFFCISYYYAFLHEKKKFRILKWVMVISMLIQAVSCTMSGGRGGFVLLLIYIIYMSYYTVRRKVISKSKLTFLAVLGIIGFIYVANRLNMWESAGFVRSSNALHDDDRIGMWMQYESYIKESPLIGHGLGGDFFTIGLYSHNMFIDFIIELGAIGCLIMTTLFYKTYIKLFKFTKLNDAYILIMILFIYGAVFNMFSGYWISTYTNWLGFGIAVSYVNQVYTNKKIS